jgi:hypothetical protein
MDPPLSINSAMARTVHRDSAGALRAIENERATVWPQYELLEIETRRYIGTRRYTSKTMKIMMPRAILLARWVPASNICGPQRLLRFDSPS